jgi:hypothetical protein
VTSRPEYRCESFSPAQFPVIEFGILRVNRQWPQNGGITRQASPFSRRFNKTTLLFSYSSFHLYHPTLTIQHTHKPSIRPDEIRFME